MTSPAVDIEPPSKLSNASVHFGQDVFGAPRPLCRPPITCNINNASASWLLAPSPPYYQETSVVDRAAERRRLTALTTALRDAARMLSSVPTPQRMVPSEAPTST